MAENFDFIIIGGSFAGMSAALALANISNEIKIAIIEKQDILNQDRKRDGRAYAISSSSLNFFQEIGISVETNQYAGKISDIKITDYKSSFFLDFIGREVDPKNGQLGQIIENYHIHNALRNKILQQTNITIFCPNSYQEIEFPNGELVSVKLDDGRIIKSKLLLACDGRFSKLRDIYKIPTTQKKYGQTAIVFNISHEKPHENIAYEKFLPGGPLAILPFKNPNQSSIVWIAPDDVAQAIISLDEENFAHQLMQKMENCLGKTEVIFDKFSYPLILIEAKKFYHEKMVLVGDAACGVHPIAGQGFNLAIAGIKILCDLIKNNWLCGLGITGSNLVESYNRKARFNAKRMLIATDVLNSLFESKSFSLGLARDLGLGFVNKLSSLKKFFIKSAGGF